MSLIRSSSSDLTTSLETAAKYLYQYGGVTLVVFGSLGCILNILVFTKKSLRKNPCSTYFIAANVFDFLFINSLLLAITLESGFNIFVTTKNTVVCRLTYYTSLFANVISTYCLILASIDRVLVTSSKVSTRQRSKYQLSYKYVIIGTIVWLLFHSPALAFTTITPINEDVSICFYQAGFYLTFVSYYSIVKETSSMLLLLVFGLWTIRNIRRSRRVNVPTITHQSGTVRQKNTNTNANTTTHTIQSKDRQFVFMVLMDILIFSVFSSTAVMFLTQQQITQYQDKSLDQVKLETFLKYMTVFFLHIPFGISCYTNLIVSKAYRNAVKNICSRE